jgi:hypothetical protein
LKPETAQQISTLLMLSPEKVSETRPLDIKMIVKYVLFITNGYNKRIMRYRRLGSPIGSQMGVGGQSEVEGLVVQFLRTLLESCFIHDHTVRNLSVPVSPFRMDYAIGVTPSSLN